MSSGLIFSIILNVLLVIIVFVFLMILLLIKKNTPVIEMYKAKKKGWPLVMFYNDDKTFEMKPIKPDSGIIESSKYGSFVVNSSGMYLDRHNKFVVVPLSSSVGISVPAKFAKASDSLKKVLGDESKLKIFRRGLMNGTIEKKTKDLFYKYAEEKIVANKSLTPENRKGLIKKMRAMSATQFDCFRESIDFSSVKSMMNSITPQNVNNKINMTLVRKMGTFGQDAMKYLMIMLIAGLAIAALIGFLLYSANNPSPEKLAAMQAGTAAVVNGAAVIG